MALFKVLTVVLLATACTVHGRPQFDNFLGSNSISESADPNSDDPMFDPHPVYNFAYQVAAEEEQSYITHQESRDGPNVQGEYSYVDPTGALVTVTYTAGDDGYHETRTVQEGFISVRPQPISSSSAFSGGSTQVVQQVLQQARPVIQTAVSQSSGSSSDSDLVAQIIAQLSPFIRDTVSQSLGGSSSSSSSSSRPATSSTLVQPLPAISSSSSSSTNSIFGSGGPSNIRVETPDFAFSKDL